MIDVRVSKKLTDFELRVDEAFAAGITVLAGASGSGKSTFLKMIAGFLAPDDGLIRLAGEPLFDRGSGVNLFPEKRRVGYVPQNYILFPHMSVLENVAFGPRALKWPKREVKEKAEEALELCGIGQHAARHPAELSGGEQQRVALARAIVTRPRLLLLDEPFSALDVRTRRAIRTEVREILTVAGIPSILVTHDPTDALAFGEEICIMERGALIQRGRFQELRSRPRSRFVAEFTGMNAFHGVAGKRADGMVGIRLEEGAHVVAVGEAEGRVLVLFDPTDITVSRQEPNNSSRNCYPVHVSEMVDEGNGQWKLVLRGSVDLTAKVSSDALREMGIVQGDALFASVKATAVRVEQV